MAKQQNTINPQGTAASPPTAVNPAPNTARVEDVRVQHVEVKVGAEVAAVLAAGGEARWRVGEVEFPVVVRRIESVVSHIGGEVLSQVGLWVDPQFEEEVNPQSPLIEGELVEASLSFDDAASPVPQYEPNGTLIEDATLSGLLWGGGGRLYIGGEVFDADQGEFQGSWDGGDYTEYDCVDFTFKIEGRKKPIGIERGRDAAEVVLTIPLYPGFGQLYVDEPIEVKEPSKAGKSHKQFPFSDGGKK